MKNSQLLGAAARACIGAFAVSTRADDEQVRWTVADRGPGIPADDLEHVFEKFFRVPGSPAGGTGLGLHITRSLLQAHGGRAQARNRDGGGAEFELSLPLGPRPALPSEGAA